MYACLMMRNDTCVTTMLLRNKWDIGKKSKKQNTLGSYFEEKEKANGPGAVCAKMCRGSQRMISALKPVVMCTVCAEERVILEN